MAELTNARIDQLPQNSSLKETYYFPIRNMDNSITERVLIAEILTSPTTGNFEWITDTPYTDGEAVTWKGEWYQADGNIAANLIPGVDPSWILISKSASGFTFWQAGVYPQDEVFVLKKMSANPAAPDIRMFWLSVLTRPYVSSDFDVELAAGDWIQIFVSATPSSGISIKDMGGYDASTNLFPDVGTAIGSGTSGAIVRGDEFTMTGTNGTIGGTLGGEEFPVGTILRYISNTTSYQTSTNWRKY